MRSLAGLATLLLGMSVAVAQPISFQLKNDVPAGQKPSLVLTAVDNVKDVVLDLARDDGEKFQQKHPGLRRGQKATLPVGDGKAGRAHWKGTLTATFLTDGTAWSYDVEFDTLVRAPLTVTYDHDHLDLAKRVLRFQMSRAAGKAEVVVKGDDGKAIGSGSATYHGEPPGTWLTLPWEQDAGNVMMMHLKVTAADGLATSVELIPWSVAIEHEDVNFATGSAEIVPGEAAKLDASLVKIRDVSRRAGQFVKVKLYVAGHTDTVGGKDHNRKLSLDRAHAIADYFRKKGLTLPISYDGFGEDSLKVQTPDETDEPRNRRADYVLGAVGNSSVGPRNVRADWKTVK
jgi:outer membrane protein OmpA-like peptidoglycan-associated protein